MDSKFPAEIPGFSSFPIAFFFSSVNVEDGTFLRIKWW